MVKLAPRSFAIFLPNIPMKKRCKNFLLCLLDRKRGQLWQQSCLPGVTNSIQKLQRIPTPRRGNFFLAITVEAHLGIVQYFFTSSHCILNSLGWIYVDTDTCLATASLWILAWKSIYMPWKEWKCTSPPRMCFHLFLSSMYSFVFWMISLFQSKPSLT